MTSPDAVQEVDGLDEVVAGEADISFIPLSDPDITTAELDAADAVLRSSETFGRTCRRSIRGGVRGVSRPKIRDSVAERHDRSFANPHVPWDRSRARR